MVGNPSSGGRIVDRTPIKGTCPNCESDDVELVEEATGKMQPAWSPSQGSHIVQIIDLYWRCASCGMGIER